MTKPDQGKFADTDTARLQDSIDEFSHPLRSGGRPEQDARTKADPRQKDIGGDRRVRDDRH